MFYPSHLCSLSQTCICLIHDLKQPQISYHKEKRKLVLNVTQIFCYSVKKKIRLSSLLIEFYFNWVRFDYLIQIVCVEIAFRVAFIFKYLLLLPFYLPLAIVSKWKFAVSNIAKTLSKHWVETLAGFKFDSWLLYLCCGQKQFNSFYAILAAAPVDVAVLVMLSLFRSVIVNISWKVARI